MEGQELAERHIALRERAGLTQEQEAKMAGVSPTTISGIESGRITRPHLKTLLKIARALGTDLGELRESGKAQAPPSPEQPSLNGLLEEERREHRRAAAVQYGLDDVRLTVDRYERYQTMSEKLDEFRKGWEARLETEDFNQAALEEGGRTASAFWPMVTALADSEMGDLMRAGSQLEEAAAQSALVPAIERYQALCHRLNSIYREKYEAKIYWLARREAS